MTEIKRDKEHIGLTDDYVWKLNDKEKTVVSDS
jgi:hypothetical protein